MELRPYQKRIANWLCQHPHACLSVGMGLGKTAAVLHFLDYTRRLYPLATTLIVAPKRVAETVWMQEAEKWELWKLLANMLLVGYISDFFTWIWGMILPADFFAALWVRICVAIPALGVFVLAAAVYMDMGLGMAPYDALPFIVHKAIGRLFFRAVRITFDLVVIALGYLFGAPFAAVTLAMAFLLGPAVEAVGNKLKPFLEAK